ncbi:hypothetical protein L1987_62845 [Smallanthus sonchifolius]|uniref:Uncharacterized protein n=1 Tax=Smallanthus sonchifolius TaxID=185202 RepID=A0ACB9CBI5_9ASTR|nr:hypothetical protein L1987_62845 [Smallanthus sonchifolius]
MERNNYSRGGYRGGRNSGCRSYGGTEDGGRGDYSRGNNRGGRNNGGFSYGRTEDGGRGGYRGGRNNGGRSYGGTEDGGRGDYGRGNSDGYNHRGGRNRNYTQQYSNQHQTQHQEHYGGGRGRGSGGYGSGRGQPTSWTPVNPRPIADPVPDSDVVSAQQIQNRVADLQIQDVQHPEDVVKGAYAPIMRPDRGTLAIKSVKLLVNHFPVKFDPSNSILRYDIDVSIKQEASSSSRSVKKLVSKSDLRLIQEKLCSDYPDKFPLLQTAYDGEKNIYSAVSLQSGAYTVELFGRSYLCTVKYGNELNLSKLQDFLNGNAMHIPRDVLQALDVVMKANLFREKVSVGRGMYPRVHKSEDDLHCGVAAYRGSQQSLKVTSNGLVMCTDYSVIPFRKRMPVLDFLKEYVWGIKVVNDILRFREDVMLALNGLRVSVTHRRTSQKYIVSGLTEKLTKDISFELEDLEGKKAPEVVMLTDYFQEKWGKEIVHKGIPCLKLGNSKKPNYVPAEFCFLAEDKRFPKEELGKEAARKLKELSLLAPNSRMNEIFSMVRDEYATGRNGAEVIKKFDIGVDMNMTEVDGRVMEPPKLKLGSSSGKTNTITVDRQKCHYNLLQGRTLVSGKAAERWALIDFSSEHRNWLNVDNFIPKLLNRCKTIGVRMEKPIFVHYTNMHAFSNLNRLGGLLKWVVDECKKIDKGRLQMIVCVMPEKNDGYKYLKWVSETEIGVITQCFLSPNANKPNIDQFLANLGMKINAKLGGSNVELIEQFPHFSGDDHFMFIGADVNHPAASNTLSPSVAAVVGSVNWPVATRYAARVSPQTHRKEEIVNFGTLCLDLVNTYAKVNGVKPNKIVVFRDGVSDAQFDMVLNKEMVEMKKAIYTQHYRPLVTFVVAQKRHTTRLFLKGGDPGNVPPGTIVDTKIVHPFEFDFYLCSHFGGMGTSKPTHYSVIWDENGFTSDEMQKLIYHMCYIFARCTKPVSLVPPVYYADLVAYRGRMFQEVAMKMQPSDSESSSFRQFFYDLEDHLKDTMFFI